MSATHPRLGAAGRLLLLAFTAISSLATVTLDVLVAAMLFTPITDDAHGEDIGRAIGLMFFIPLLLVGAFCSLSGGITCVVLCRALRRPGFVAIAIGASPAVIIAAAWLAILAIRATVHP